MAKKDDGAPSGVRGPGGPPPASGRSGASAASNRPRPTVSPARARIERASFPFLTAMHAIPRWVMVVLPAVVLFAGLVMPTNLALLGALLFVVLGLFLGWLLVISWPVLKPGSRYMRLLTVIVIFGLAWLKGTGAF